MDKSDKIVLCGILVSIGLYAGAMIERIAIHRMFDAQENFQIDDSTYVCYKVNFKKSKPLRSDV